MKASIVDLRYRMKDVLKALRRNEEVEVLYHGKTAGKIISVRAGKSRMPVAEHPFFGASKASRDRKSVDAALESLRRGRYDAL